MWWRVILYSFIGSVIGLVYGLALYYLIWMGFSDDLSRSQVVVGIAHGQLTTFGWTMGAFIGAITAWRRG